MVAVDSHLGWRCAAEQRWDKPVEKPMTNPGVKPDFNTGRKNVCISAPLPGPTKDWALALKIDGTRLFSNLPGPGNATDKVTF